MKTKKLILAAFSLFVIGCSVDESKELLTVEENLITVKESNKEMNQSNLDLSTCEETNRTINIFWRVPLTNTQKNDIRTFFEQNYGKHPLTAIDPNGRNETWIFNLSIIQLPALSNNSDTDECDRANDVVKEAIIVQEEIDLDD
ncbi:hypothetical protein [Aquimarina rubra]|uniref:Lipoprotein n=1 Tax=Aquimarina rubra TaxID=1920033 RepID=A0ABW5LAQ7_9FLAO